jgi:hypothetical protein
MDTKQQDNQARSTLATGSQPVLAGGIWASCGHKLADDDGTDGMGFGTITLGDDCDFDGVHRCAFYGSACRKCYDEMEARNMLATSEEADRWIKTGELPERMRCEKPNNPVGHDAKRHCP